MSEPAPVWHLATASDGAAYPCTCPILVDHPFPAITPDEYIAQVRWKAVAESGDALLRAVMDAMGCRMDQDPVIFARQLRERADKVVES